MITSIAEITSQTQLEGSGDVSKEATPKGANGETGVAGNKQNSKRNHSAKGVGIAVTTGHRDERVFHEKDKSRDKDKDRDTTAQTTKASRRATSLLNLFMSNSQGRSKVRKKKKTKLQSNKQTNKNQQILQQSNLNSFH